MRTNSLLRTLAFGAFLLLMSSCTKEGSISWTMKCHIEEVSNTAVTVSFTAETPTNVTGYLVGVVVAEGDPMEDDGPDEGFGDMVEAKPGRKKYKMTIEGLKAETKYHVRAYILAGPGGLATWGSMSSFTTKKGSKPSILSVKFPDISTTFVHLAVEWDDNAAEISDSGVILATSENELSSSTALKYYSPWSECFCSGLEPSTKYYAKAFATNKKGTSYSDVFTFTTSSYTPNHMIGDAVDLGLSVKWSNMNVGATAPEDHGDYFAWGETVPKSMYSYETYEYFHYLYYLNTDGFYDWGHILTKYCSNPDYGIVDNKTVLETNDDAASVNWGGKWRIPTAGEWEELLDESNCNRFRKVINNVPGWVFYSRKTGYTDNWIFLPLAGFRENYELVEGFERGIYWSSNRSRDKSVFVVYELENRCVEFDRVPGLPIRPVCD